MVHLIDLSRLASSRLSPSVRTKGTSPKTGRTHDSAASVRHWHGKAVDAGATASPGSELSSNDDDSDSSNSDPDLSSDDDEDSSAAEQRRSSASKQSRWSDLDERRLLAYEKAGKSWEWIFCKFPGRTRAGDTYTLEHGSGPEAIRVPCRWTGSSSSSPCLLVPRCLPERIFESDLIPLSASPIAGAGTVEGSGVQSEANKGLDVWARHQK